MNERRRTMLFSGGYKIPTENGVYIETIVHKFYTVDEWDTANTANSIAVVTNKHNFRIALSGTRLSMSSSLSDPWETYLSGTTNSGKPNTLYAELDYSGATNTKLIVEKCNSSTDYAAGWCNAYTFPDGKTKGYLPACGELYLAYQNKNDINAALAKCGGTALSDYHWSSTFYGSYNRGRLCWTLNWYDGNFYTTNLDYGTYVRPFASLEDSN